MKFPLMCEECEGMFWRSDIVDAPLQTCLHCEKEFCWGCYMRHECDGHKREIFDCFSCGTELASGSKELVYINEDPFCSQCARERPWEKRKEARK